MRDALASHAVTHCDTLQHTNRPGPCATDRCRSRLTIVREGAVPPLITLCTRNDMLVLKHVSGALAKLALDPHAREQVRDSNYTIIHRNPHAR